MRNWSIYSFCSFWKSILPFGDVLVETYELKSYVKLWRPFSQFWQKRFFMYLFLENHWAEWLQLWTTYSLKCSIVLDEADFLYLPWFFYYVDMCVEKPERFRAHFGRLAKMLPRQYKERYQKSAPSVFKWEYELPVYQISSIYLQQFSQKRYIKSAEKRGGSDTP